jgi:GAF domain-containing protein/PAS domain-containing protein/CheY-like chemotaxis protein
MVEPLEGHDEERSPDLLTRFRDELAYLVLFSEALLDLIPDGVVVLDDSLRVRNANEAFARSLGFESVEEIRGLLVEDRPLFCAKVPSFGNRTLAEVLRSHASRGEGLVLERLEIAPAEGQEREEFSVRSAVWETNDPEFRRILLHVRQGVRPSSSALETAAGPSLEEQDVSVLSMKALADGLLELVREGVCVLGPGLLLRRVNARFEELFGRKFDPTRSGDRHIFAVFPSLRNDALREFLESVRADNELKRARFELSGIHGPIHADLEARSIGGSTGDASELLVILHEVEGMSPAPVVRSESSPILTTPSEILARDNLDRWPAPETTRILVVDADPWMRMVYSDTLRGRVPGEIELAESGADALARHDPASFGLIVVGFTGDPDDALRFCQRAGTHAPRVPILAVTNRAPEEDQPSLEGLRLLGALTGSFRKDVFREVVMGVLRSPERTSAPATAKRFGVILLGAGDSDVAVLRLLYRVPKIRIQMVYDPDPDAFGLSLAQNLGIPAVSGSLSLSLETPPDAVVLARPELEKNLAALNLQNVVRITREEIELFLVDPQSFLEAERIANRAASRKETKTSEEPKNIAPRASGFASSPAPSSSAEPAMPRFDREIPAPPAPRVEREAPLPAVPSAGREAPAAPPSRLDRGIPAGTMPPPMPLPAPVRAEPRAAAPRSPASVENASGGVESVIGAMDLLLDFGRFTNYVLETALDLVHASSGCLLMLDEEERVLRCVASSGMSEEMIPHSLRPGEGVGGRVVETGEPVLLPGMKTADFGSTGHGPWNDTSIWVPVSAEGRVVGVLNVNSDPRAQSLGAKELHALERLGRNVGAALDRCRRLRAARPPSLEDSIRQEITACATGGGDLDRRLSRIAERIVALLDMDTCSIYLFDSVRRELCLHTVAGLDLAGPDTLSVPVGKGAVGWVAKNLRPLVLRSAASAEEGAAPAHTTLGIPIRFRTSLAGVLALESSAVFSWTEDRAKLLSQIATVVGRQIGPVWTRAGTAQTPKRGVLDELGLALTAVRERASLARLVALSATTVIESDVSSLRLQAEGARASSRDVASYELLAVHGGAIPDPLDPLGELETFIAREVIARGVAVRDNDVPGIEVKRLLERSNVSAFLGVPIHSSEGLLGVLTLYRVEDGANPTPFAEGDMEIGQQLAGHVAVAAARLQSS